jgi:hypothetical protein
MVAFIFSPMFAKRSALALALALVGTSLSLPGRVQAQQQQAAPAANQRAATVDDLSTYITMAAINMCVLAEQKVPFQAARNSNLQMLVSVLYRKHGAKVPGAQAPLTQEQLATGSEMQLVLRVDGFCGKNLPPDWKKEFDPLLARVKQAVQSAGKTAPK